MTVMIAGSPSSQLVFPSIVGIIIVQVFTGMEQELENGDMEEISEVQTYFELPTQLFMTFCILKKHWY